MAGPTPVADTAPHGPAPKQKQNPVPTSTVQGPQTVFINRSTGVAVQTTDPTEIASLISAGFTVGTVPAGQWDAFVASMGPNLTTQTPGTQLPGIPVAAATPMSQADIDAMNAYYAQNDAAATAGQENLVKAFQISQPGRDRAALQTKENYGAKIQPTLTAAALSGAGYNQALGDIFTNSVERDRTLAGLADQNTAEQFQLQTSQQNIEAQRQQQAQAAYNEMLNQLQQRWDSRVKTTLDWVV